MAKKVLQFDPKEQELAAAGIDVLNNVLWIGETGYESAPEHIIVKQDEFRSGMECATCENKDVRNNVSYLPCPECGGKGKHGVKKCSHCDGVKSVPCPDCKGKGGSIIIPDSAKPRPTTGVVVSVGSNTTLYKRGDRVCYPQFAGHGFDLSGITKSGKVVTAIIVVLVERDVICKVHGELLLKNVKKSVALHTNQ